jgi:hypothetical protein
MSRYPKVPLLKYLESRCEKWYMQALKGYEKTIRLEYMSTPRMVNNLDLLCASQSKMMEAEDMCMRMVRGYEKA